MKIKTVTGKQAGTLVDRLEDSLDRMEDPDHLIMTEYTKTFMEYGCTRGGYISEHPLTFNGLPIVIDPYLPDKRIIIIGSVNPVVIAI